MMSHWKNVDKACQREHDDADCHVKKKTNAKNTIAFGLSKKNERQKDDSIWHVAQKNTIAIGMSKKNEREKDDSIWDVKKKRTPNSR